MRGLLQDTSDQFNDHFCFSVQGFILGSIWDTERCPSYYQIIDVRKNKQKSTDVNVTITQRGALSVTQARGQHHADAFSKERKKSNQADLRNRVGAWQKSLQNDEGF